MNLPNVGQEKPRQRPRPRAVPAMHQRYASPHTHTLCTYCNDYTRTNEDAASSRTNDSRPGPTAGPESGRPGEGGVRLSPQHHDNF